MTVQTNYEANKDDLFNAWNKFWSDRSAQSFRPSQLDVILMFCQWLNQPAKPKLNEYEKSFVLWARRFGFEWISRMGNNMLVLSVDKPDKEGGFWTVHKYGWVHVTGEVTEHLQLVKSSDNQPTRLSDLLEV